MNTWQTSNIPLLLLHVQLPFVIPSNIKHDRTFGIFMEAVVQLMITFWICTLLLQTHCLHLQGDWTVQGGYWNEVLEQDVSVNTGGCDGFRPITATEGARGGIWTLNDAFTIYYAPTNQLTVVKVTALFTERVNFKQYIPKKLKWLGIEFYKLYDIRRYTYDMDMYWVKNRTRVTTHEHFLSSPELCDDLTKRKTNCCRTERVRGRECHRTYCHAMIFCLGQEVLTAVV